MVIRGLRFSSAAATSRSPRSNASCNCWPRRPQGIWVPLLIKRIAHIGGWRLMDQSREVSCGHQYAIGGEIHAKGKLRGK